MLITLCMNNGANMDGTPRGSAAAAEEARIRRPLMGLGLSIIMAMFTRLLNG